MSMKIIDGTLQNLSTGRGGVENKRRPPLRDKSTEEPSRAKRPKSLHAISQEKPIREYFFGSDYSWHDQSSKEAVYETNFDINKIGNVVVFANDQLLRAKYGYSKGQSFKFSTREGHNWSTELVFKDTKTHKEIVFNDQNPPPVGLRLKVFNSVNYVSPNA